MQNKELDNYSFIMGYMEGIATAIHIQTSMNCETNISELDEGTIKNLTEAWYKDLKIQKKQYLLKQYTRLQIKLWKIHLFWEAK